MINILCKLLGGRGEGYAKGLNLYTRGRVDVKEPPEIDKVI